MTKRKESTSLEEFLRQEEKKKEAFKRCMVGGCRGFKSQTDCLRCRHNEAEAARRKALPLVRDPETGLYRKYLGTRPSGKTQEDE